MKEYTNIHDLNEDLKSGKIKKGESVKLTESDDQKPIKKPLDPKEFEEKLNILWQKTIFWSIRTLIGSFALFFIYVVLKAFHIF